MQDDNFFANEVRHYVDHVKGAAPAADFNEVLVPGEPDRWRVAERAADGISLRKDKWNSIFEAAEKVYFSPADARAMAEVINWGAAPRHCCGCARTP